MTQVEDDLLQLNSISLDERQALREFRLQRYAALHQLPASQGDNLENDRVDLHAILAWPLLSDEPANSVDDLAGSLAVIDDLGERLPGHARSDRAVDAGLSDHAGRSGRHAIRGA
jgi:hypothetical protein